MTQTTRITLYIIGALLMAIPGLFTTGMRFFFMAFVAAGYLLLITATVKYDFTKPKTALLLLIVSNLSFWLSYGLWLMRSRIVGQPPKEGIDPFAGPVSLWLVIFLTFVLYEAAIFLMGITVNRERSVAAVGLAAIVVQILVTMRTIYVMIQGV